MLGPFRQDHSHFRCGIFHGLAIDTSLKLKMGDFWYVAGLEVILLIVMMLEVWRPILEDV